MRPHDVRCGDDKVRPGRFSRHPLLGFAQRRADLELSRHLAIRPMQTDWLRTQFPNVDCGQVLNPNGVKAQIEGGCTMGLSAALREAITIRNGVAQEQNFNRYQPLRIPDTPVFETYLVDSNREPGGIGELGITLAAPIVANAMFAATGRRLRRLPFRLDEASL
jgi:hypothetical protein